MNPFFPKPCTCVARSSYPFAQPSRHLPNLHALVPQVRPSFFTREEFKTAANAITQTGYTPEHRSNVEDLLGVSVLAWLGPTHLLSSPGCASQLADILPSAQLCACLPCPAGHGSADR